MGGLVVIPLVGLVFPILLMIGAIGAGGAVASWVAYQLWHEKEHHFLGLFHR